MPSRLRVCDNGRYLVDATGAPQFLNVDTAWGLFCSVRREDVLHYLAVRQQQRFNGVAACALFFSYENAYGYKAFGSDGGRPDPSRPVTSVGRGSSDSDLCSFWEHVDWVVDQVKAHGMYLILLPAWGNTVAGNWSGKDTSEIIFEPANAYGYGKFVGSRYRSCEHVIWMLGGDRSAIYSAGKDYRKVFRAMAQGIRDGINEGVDAPESERPILMSYHPRKGHPQSSHWFHQDDWLSFNSNQHWTEDQVSAITHDWHLEPVKPTWLFEGRYEKSQREWEVLPWQVRYQAYQTVFAGGFGHTYGHSAVIRFDDGWKEELHAEGALDMKHPRYLFSLLTKEEYLSRVPRPELVAANPGTTRGGTSNRIEATGGRNGDYAMFYSASGREIAVLMEKLQGPALDAYWFDPREGTWWDNGVWLGKPKAFQTGLRSGEGSPVLGFAPPGGPGEGNDWVLVLKRSR